MMLNKKGVVLPPLLIWTVIIVGSILIARDAAKKGYLGIEPIVSPTPVANSTETSTPTIQPLSTPTPLPPKPMQKAAYVDPDPIIDCKSSYEKCLGQSIKVKKNACNNIICCQIGDKWSIYPTSDQCHKDQDAANKQIRESYNQQINNTYTPSTYPPCTVNYSSGAYTYTTISPEECKRQQDSAKAGSTNTYSAAPIPVAAPADKSQVDIDKCKSDVRAKYLDLQNNCSTYGDTSIARQCLIAWGNEKNKELAACGN